MKNCPESPDLRISRAKWLVRISLCLIFALQIYPSLSFSQQPTQEWVRRFNWNSYSGGLDVQLDSSGNVYVLMRLVNSSTSNDYGVAKYTPAGILLWGVNYNNSNDQPKAFAVSKTGDVYITGTTTVSFESHITTVKFNTDGILQWAKVYNGGGPDDAPTDIKIDNSGNIIVAGNTNIGGDTVKALTVKYNQNGDTLWVKKFTQLPDDSGTSQIVIDTANNIFIVGDYGYHINLPDFLTIKYNPSGTLLWYSTYDSPQSYQDLAERIALDSIGNLYVVGTTQVPSGAGHNDVLIKLNNNGIIQWTKIFKGILTGNGNGGYILPGIAVSSDNNSIYYTTLCLSAVANSEIVTIKYNNSGDSIWTKRYFGGVNGASNYPTALRLDKDNNIYVCGVGNRPVSGDDYVIIKYLPDGTQQWVAFYNGPLSNSNDLCKGMYIDKNYDVYITGQSSYFNSGPILWEATTIKYGQPLGIHNQNNGLPRDYELFQNYPNPFNSGTIINYSLLKNSYVHVNLYNPTGQLVKNIVNEKQSAGYYSIFVNLNDLPSGVYFYSLVSDNSLIDTKKLILIK
jgi:hypothetical protein